MELIRLLLKVLFKDRIGWITGLSVLFFVIACALGILLWDCLPEGGIERQSATIISSIFLGIGTSLLAAALVIGFDTIQFDKSSKLLRLLGVDRYKKVAIIIPRMDHHYFAPDDSQPTTKRVKEWHGIASADFRTAKYLTALFQSHGLPIPEIITVEDAKAAILEYSRIKDYGAFISIGLYSNGFSALVNESNCDGRLFFFDQHDDVNPGKRRIRYKEVAAKSQEEWPSLTSAALECSDIALFSKVTYRTPSDYNLNVVVLGGLNMTGTNLIGKHIYEKWYSDMCRILVRNESNEQKNILGCDHFRLLYKIDGELNVRFSPKASIGPEPMFPRGN